MENSIGEARECARQTESRHDGNESRKIFKYFHSVPTCLASLRLSERATNVDFIGLVGHSNLDP